MRLVNDLLNRHKRMQEAKNPFTTYYKQLADVLLPGQADFTGSNTPGSQSGQGIYDGTPRLAVRDLATTIDGLTKPKSSSWFDCEIDDPDLMEMDEVKAHLQIRKDRMWNAIYRKDARFIQRSGEVDLALVVFGWGVLWIGENNAKNALTFRSFHHSKTAIDENEEGVVDAIDIADKLSPRQAEAMYRKAGQEPSQKIKDALEKQGTDKEFEFVQLVLPNNDFDAKRIDINGKKFLSAVIDVSEEKIIAEAGFHEFPAAVPRWDTSAGELYVRCSPGMLALPDANTLQAMGKTLLVGGQRAVDPPIWVMNDSVMSPLRTYPGGVTVLDSSDLTTTPIGAFPVTTNLPLGREMQNDYRRQVEAAFFKNVFNLPIEGRDMTATEIIARKEEFIRVIGPVFGRLETDYIGHIVERVHGIMERAGAFPPRPDAMADKKITFRFQSPIQKARRQMDIASLSQALTFLAPLAEAQPELLDNFDGDKISRDAPEWAGLPQKWLVGVKERDERRKARADAGAMQQQLAAAGPLSQSIKNIADAGVMNPTAAPV